MMYVLQRRGGVDRCHGIAQVGGGVACEIKFRHNELICHGDLFARFGLTRQRGIAVHGIDDGDDTRERNMPGQRVIDHQALQDRRRIRQPAGLDDDTLEV